MFVDFMRCEVPAEVNVETGKECWGGGGYLCFRGTDRLHIQGSSEDAGNVFL
jgi:hypothetical protein